MRLHRWSKQFVFGCDTASVLSMAEEPTWVERQLGELGTGLRRLVVEFEGVYAHLDSLGLTTMDRPASLSLSLFFL